MAVNSALSVTYHGISEKRAEAVEKRFVGQDLRERLPEIVTYVEENAKAGTGKECQSQRPNYIA